MSDIIISKSSNPSRPFNWYFNFINQDPIDLSQVKGLTVIDEVTDFDGKQYDHLLERLKKKDGV